MDLFPAILNEYGEYLREKLNLNGNTVRSYKYDLRIFLLYILNRNHFESDELYSDKLIKHVIGVRAPDIYSFMNYSKAQRENSHYANNRKLTSIKSFYSYIIDILGMRIENPAASIDPVKVHSGEPETLDEDMIIKLFSNVRSRHKYRDMSIINLFVHCALKTREIANLKFSDYEGSMLSAGNKLIRLNRSTIQTLDNYIHMERGNLDSEAIFVSQKNLPISSRTIQNIIMNLKIDSMLDEKKITPEVLRSNAVKNIIEHSNMDPEKLRKYLGYKNLVSVEKYFENEEFEEKSFLNLEKFPNY